MKKLNDKESTFAAENHELVLKFLKGRRLNDDYYDIVVFGYIKAVIAYVNSQELQLKYPFAQIANRKMKDALINYYIYLDRKKRAGEKAALRYSYFEEINRPYSYCIEEEIINRILYQEIFSMLTAIERKILILKLKQYQNKEIIKKCHIKTHIFYHHIRVIQSKLGYETYEMLMAA